MNTDQALCEARSTVERVETLALFIWRRVSVRHAPSLPLYHTSQNLSMGKLHKKLRKKIPKFVQFITCIFLKVWYNIVTR